MTRHRIVLITVADAVLAARLSQLVPRPVVLLELPVRAVPREELPEVPVLFRGKPKAATGKTHERKRAEREQRKLHGQKMRGR